MKRNFNRIIGFFIFRLLNITKRLYWTYIYHDYKKKYSIDDGFRFNGHDIQLYGDGRIVCGCNSYIGKYSSIQAFEGCVVEIGNNCSISHFVSMYTYNHSADKDFRISNKTKRGDIRIGDFCWIGIKTTIVGPVTIGDNCVIGANSLVTRSLPPNSIAVGVPAKVVKFKNYVPLEKQKEYALKYDGVLSEKLKKELLNDESEKCSWI